jgi:hypothetical protein
MDAIRGQVRVAVRHCARTLLPLRMTPRPFPLKAGQIAIQLARRHSRREMELHAGLAAERPAAATLRHRGHDEKSYTYRTASAMTNSFTVA